MSAARLEFLLTAFFLSMMMTLIISGVSTFIGVGISAAFLLLWMKAWGTSWLVAFPSVVFVLPLVKRFVHKIVFKFKGEENL